MNIKQHTYKRKDKMQSSETPVMMEPWYNQLITW